MIKKIISSLLIVLILTGCDSGREEILILPKGYTGYVLIIFNQKHGNPVKYENNKRVYEISQNGILRTQFKGNYGSVGFGEYYYDSITPKNKIPACVDFKTVSEDSIVGLRGGTGTVKKSSNGEERIEFAEFYIGTKSQINEAREEADNLDIVKMAE